MLKTKAIEKAEKKKIKLEKKKEIKDQCKFYMTMKNRMCGQPLIKDSQKFCRFHYGKTKIYL